MGGSDLAVVPRAPPTEACATARVRRGDVDPSLAGSFSAIGRQSSAAFRESAHSSSLKSWFKFFDDRKNFSATDISALYVVWRIWMDSRDDSEKD